MCADGLADADAPVVSSESEPLPVSLTSALMSVPMTGGGLLRLLGVVAAAWVGLLAMWLIAAGAAQRARARARSRRIEAGTMTLSDVIDLMRDTVDGTGAPYWPQRSLLSNPLLTSDVPLLSAWVHAGQPLARLLTFRQAGYTEDQISRHLSGVAPIEVATADMLAALRHPTA